VTVVARFTRHPDSAVVAQRFAHQGQFGLVLARRRNAGGVNLHKAGVGKLSAPFVGSPGRGGVAAFGVGRQKIGVAVAAGRQHHGIGQIRLYFAADHIAGNDAPRPTIDYNQIQHFGAGI